MAVDPASSEAEPKPCLETAPMGLADHQLQFLPATLFQPRPNFLHGPTALTQNAPFIEVNT